MKEILFKVKDNKLHIIVDDDFKNEDFLSCLKQRLQRLLILKNDISKEAVLEISNRTLDNREILQLFDILNDFDMFYLEKVICKNSTKDNLIIYKGTIRSGQCRFFESSALIIGTINRGSKVIVNGNLYVLGRINGDIELRDSECKIYCENICNSLVKISNVYKLYSDDLFSKEIYLSDKEIFEKDYKKGEIISGKSNSSYIG